MCAGWRQGKYPKKGKYLGESDEIFIVCRGENCLLVNTADCPQCRRPAVVKGESSRPIVIVSACPRGHLLASRLCHHCWCQSVSEHVFSTFHTNNSSKVMILAQRSIQLSTSSHQKIIHSCFITPWWCESVEILFVCPPLPCVTDQGKNWRQLMIRDKDCYLPLFTRP